MGLTLRKKNLPVVRVCGEPERYASNAVYWFENEYGEKVGVANVLTPKSLHFIEVNEQFRRKGYGLAIVGELLSDGGQMDVPSIGSAMPFWRAAQRRYGDRLKILWP